ERHAHMARHTAISKSHARREYRRRYSVPSGRKSDLGANQRVSGARSGSPRDGFRNEYSWTDRTGNAIKFNGYEALSWAVEACSISANLSNRSKSHRAR